MEVKQQSSTKQFVNQKYEQNKKQIQKSQFTNIYEKNLSGIKINKKQLLQSLHESQIIYLPYSDNRQLKTTQVTPSINSQTFKLNVTMGSFSFKIRVLNVAEQSHNHESSAIGQGTFGTVYPLNIWNNFYDIKCISYQSNNEADYYHNLLFIIREYCFYKLFSALKIGPHFSNPLGFDIVVYNKCAEFALQHCQEIGKQHLQHLQGLKVSLKAMHSFNIVHRDIKPDNIMFSNHYNKCVLIDLGATVQIHQQIGFKTNTTFKGTPSYVSKQMLSILDSVGDIDLYYNDYEGLAKTIKKYDSQRNQTTEQFFGEEFQYNKLIASKFLIAYHQKLSKDISYQVVWNIIKKSIAYYRKDIIEFLFELQPSEYIRNILLTILAYDRNHQESLQLINQLTVQQQIYSKEKIITFNIPKKQSKSKKFEPRINKIKTYFLENDFILESHSTLSRKTILLDYKNISFAQYSKIYILYLSSKTLQRIDEKIQVSKMYIQGNPHLKQKYNQRKCKINQLKPIKIILQEIQNYLTSNPRYNLQLYQQLQFIYLLLFRDYQKVINLILLVIEFSNNVLEAINQCIKLYFFYGRSLDSSCLDAANIIKKQLKKWSLKQTDYQNCQLIQLTLEYVNINSKIQMLLNEQSLKDTNKFIQKLNTIKYKSIIIQRMLLFTLIILSKLDHNLQQIQLQKILDEQIQRIPLYSFLNLQKFNNIESKVKSSVGLQNTRRLDYYLEKLSQYSKCQQFIQIYNGLQLGYNSLKAKKFSQAKQFFKRYLSFYENSYFYLPQKQKIIIFYMSTNNLNQADEFIKSFYQNIMKLYSQQVQTANKSRKKLYRWTFTLLRILVVHNLQLDLDELLKAFKKQYQMTPGFHLLKALFALKEQLYIEAEYHLHQSLKIDSYSDTFICQQCEFRLIILLQKLEKRKECQQLALKYYFKFKNKLKSYLIDQQLIRIIFKSLLNLRQGINQCYQIFKQLASIQDGHKYKVIHNAYFIAINCFLLSTSKQQAIQLIQVLLNQPFEKGWSQIKQLSLLAFKVLQLVYNIIQISKAWRIITKVNITLPLLSKMTRKQILKSYYQILYQLQTKELKRRKVIFLKKMKIINQQKQLTIKTINKYKKINIKNEQLKNIIIIKLKKLIRIKQNLSNC